MSLLLKLIIHTKFVGWRRILTLLAIRYTPEIYSVVVCFLLEVLFISVDRNKYQIHIPLPPKIDPTVTMMQVEEKPDVTYSDVGGCKEQIEKLREVVETPLLHVSVYGSKSNISER